MHDDTDPGATIAVTDARTAAPRRRDALANQERVLAAAVTTMLREGRQVPMARIAQEAGVGVGTLYRGYPNREALLEALTERSFGLVRALLETVAARPGTAPAALERFLQGTIDHRDQLVLPLHGGPAALTATARALQADIAAGVDALLQRGRSEGTIREEVTSRDVILFGAMLAQPLPGADDWDSTARRQATFYLAGITTDPGARPPATPSTNPREDTP